MAVFSALILEKVSLRAVFILEKMYLYNVFVCKTDS